jgi:hypothetical protein
VLVEKILRVQPDVKKLYLLVRAPDAASAEQRILSQVSQSHAIAFDDQSSDTNVRPHTNRVQTCVHS